MAYNPVFEKAVRSAIREAFPRLDVRSSSWVRTEGFIAFVVRTEEDMQEVLEVVTNPANKLIVTEQTDTRVFATVEGYVR